MVVNTKPLLLTDDMLAGTVNFLFTSLKTKGWLSEAKVKAPSASLQVYIYEDIKPVRSAMRIMITAHHICQDFVSDYEDDVPTIEKPTSVLSGKASKRKIGESE